MRKTVIQFKEETFLYSSGDGKTVFGIVIIFLLSSVSGFYAVNLNYPKLSVLLLIFDGEFYMDFLPVK